MRITSVIFFLFLASFVNAQSYRIGLFGGISNYQGDLVDKSLILRFSKPAVGLTFSIPYNDHFEFRAGITTGMLRGADYASNDSALRARNLEFSSRIHELSLVAVYRIFNSEMRFTPYVFGGLAGFRFNPYAKDSAGNKVYLQPLGTEGQGIDGYRKKYARTQVAIPFGAGLRFAITPRLDAALEVGFRKTFTDYLDDVSNVYPDEQKLREKNGATAVQFSYRTDELPGGRQAFPPAGTQRGSRNQKDFYTISGLHITYSFGKDAVRRHGKGIGCPKEVL